MENNILSESIDIKLNIEAPKFEVIDVFGRNISLEAYRGKKVFIGFFRHAGCPYCNLRVRLLKKKREEFLENGLEMIFFFESNQDTLAESTFHKKVNPTPIISDPEKHWYKIYGVQESGSKATVSHLTSFIQTAIKAKIHSLPVHRNKDGESLKTMPAEFLLNEDLKIQKIHYSDGLNNRIAIDEILDFAKNM